MTPIELKEEFVKRGRTLGCVESFTGGLFAREMTRIPGASKFFKGGIVTYATEVKTILCGVSEYAVKQFGVVSQEVAMEMAAHGKHLLNVDYCISFTGNAGPDAMEGKPVGEIYIGIAYFEEAKVYAFLLKGSREDIQKEGVNNALAILEKKISKKM